MPLAAKTPLSGITFTVSAGSMGVGRTPTFTCCPLKVAAYTFRPKSAFGLQQRMDIRLVDFIKGNCFYSILPCHLLRPFCKSGARREDERIRAELLMLSLHLLDPPNVSRPRVIAALEGRRSPECRRRCPRHKRRTSRSCPVIWSRSIFRFGYRSARREVHADQVNELLKLITTLRHTSGPFLLSTH